MVGRHNLDCFSAKIITKWRLQECLLTKLPVIIILLCVSLNKEKAFVGPLTGHCEISIRVHHPDHGGHNNGPQVIRLMVTLRGDIAAM